MLLRLLRSIWHSREAGKPAPVATAQDAYSSAIFSAADLRTAKMIILNPASDMSTDERWEVETRNIVDALGPEMKVNARSRLVDYGCGIGRVARALIERYGCSVVGVDISPEMRAFAGQYVDSPRFAAASPEEFDRMVGGGYRATGAYACWVLQHCREPEEDIARVASALGQGGMFFVLNSGTRWVPVAGGWAEDGISVKSLLKKRFDKVAEADVHRMVRSPSFADGAYAWFLSLR